MDGQGYIARMVRINGRRRYERQHRVVMEQIIGRKLVTGETVHHLNGQRHQNNPENLQLWSTHQPAGQRIEDKVSWAYELIAMYDPEGLQRPPAT